MVEKVPMTRKGFDALNEEIRWRQQEERPRIIGAKRSPASNRGLLVNRYAAQEYRLAVQ